MAAIVSKRGTNAVAELEGETLKFLILAVANLLVEQLPHLDSSNDYPRYGPWASFEKDLRWNRNYLLNGLHDLFQLLYESVDALFLPLDTRTYFSKEEALFIAKAFEAYDEWMIESWGRSWKESLNISDQVWDSLLSQLTKHKRS